MSLRVTRVALICDERHRTNGQIPQGMEVVLDGDRRRVAELRILADKWWLPVTEPLATYTVADAPEWALIALDAIPWIPESAWRI